MADILWRRVLRYLRTIGHAIVRELSNTIRCYLSSPSAIYFWRLINAERTRDRERKERRRNGLHTDEWRRDIATESAKRVNAFQPINAFESRFSHFFPIKSHWNGTGSDVLGPCHTPPFPFVCPPFTAGCDVLFADGAKLIEIRSRPRRRKLETTLRN